MSFLVVVGVAVLVFFYIRGTRQARLAWLQKLDLPGTWNGDDGQQRQLKLLGRLDEGEFEYSTLDEQWRGRWQLRGHTLTLQGQNRAQAFDLHLFKPGNIGLADTNGARKLYTKQASNVVSLDRARQT